ncbi:hypothetical protein G9A89_006694, partial [Geosiphon pyriformis]
MSLGVGLPQSHNPALPFGDQVQISGTIGVGTSAQQERGVPVSQPGTTGQIEGMFLDLGQPATETDVRQLPLDQIRDKRCWICFGEESDSDGDWVRPCRCTLICHEQCLLYWISESQRGTPLKRVRCPQCRTTYHLAETTSTILYFLSFIDSKIQASIPYIGVFGASFCVAMGT